MPDVGPSLFRAAVVGALILAIAFGLAILFVIFGLPLLVAWLSGPATTN
jgi:hypothetical protein